MLQTQAMSVFSLKDDEKDDDQSVLLQLINNLTVKTLELGNALQYKKMVSQRNSEPGVRSQCDSDTESRVGVTGVLPERVASPEHKPERGSLSLHIGTPRFESCVSKGSLNTLFAATARAHRPLRWQRIRALVITGTS